MSRETWENNATRLFGDAQDISSLQRLISALEERNGLLKFTTIRGSLHHGLSGGWTEVEHFRGYPPGADEFAEELNKVVEPVVRKYANLLRQELANLCADCASGALAGRKDS